MKNLIFFDDDARDGLLPLTFTRPVCELRCGILTLREKWERLLGGTGSFVTQDYLSDKYDIAISETNYMINGSVLPSDSLVEAIESLRGNEALLEDGDLIAARLDQLEFQALINDSGTNRFTGIELESGSTDRIHRPYHLFQKNDQEIRADFALLTKGRTSQPLDATNTLLGPADRLFLEEGATVLNATLNTTTGPIYIGKDAQIMEGCLVRGPLALCEHGVLKMGAKIYGATTVGPWSKVGGEVNNSILTGFSNKGHEGFLGNSVLGEWCNLGADTNNSNLKNNYGEVKVWSYVHEEKRPSGLQFCGLIMGDHSKAGINTMFNTGTVVGVGCNIFGGGYPDTFIPSFTWGGTGGQSVTHRTVKMFEAAQRMMERRGETLNTVDRMILIRIEEEEARYRHWE